MPSYIYQCAVGHRFERFLTISSHRRYLPCDCGVLAEQIITAPVLVYAQPECRYDSPVTGEAITTWAQRQNDLAKHDCVPYDPEQKTDYLNRMKAGEDALDTQIDRFVESKWAHMTTGQRNQLASELVEQGSDIAYTRSTPNVA